MYYHIRHHDVIFTVLLLLASSLVIADPDPSSSDKKSSSVKIARRLLRGYERLPPPDGPTVVQLGIYINYLYDISEQTMDYRLSFYLRRNWTDSRLQFNATENGGTRLKLDVVTLGRLWIPDVFISNEKGASSHKVTTNNELMYLNDTGNIWFVSKITTTLSCQMSLQKYPMDTQNCPIMFKSYGYPEDTILYKWLPDGEALQFDPTACNPHVQPEMSIIGTATERCLFNDTYADPPGLYPCLVATFTVQRKLGYFIIQFYFPSVLLVMMSWVSFWISSDAVVARVSIGLLTILNLVTQSTGSRDQLPKVSYIKAIDVWNTTCLIFAFASLIEFATVNVWSRTASRLPPNLSPTPPPGPPKSPASITPPPGPLMSTAPTTPPPSPAFLRPDKKNDDFPLNGTRGGSPGRGARRTLGSLTSLLPPVLPIASLSAHQHRAKALDRLSRKVFPVLFLLFNAVYWLAYCL